MGPPCSDRITRVPPYSSSAHQNVFRIRGYHPLWPAFPDGFANRFDLMRTWTAPVSFATTTGISVDFFSSGYLDVSVRRVRFMRLCIQRMTPARSGRVSPFGHPRFKACLPAPRGLSQATTSFIACNRLGIHRVHLVA